MDIGNERKMQFNVMSLNEVSNCGISNYGPPQKETFERYFQKNMESTKNQGKMKAINVKDFLRFGCSMMLITCTRSRFF